MIPLDDNLPCHPVKNVLYIMYANISQQSSDIFFDFRLLPVHAGPEVYSGGA